MKTYLVTLMATYRVQAENAAQAEIAGRAITSIGERCGCRRAGPHDALTHYEVACLSETRRVRREEGAEQPLGVDRET